MNDTSVVKSEVSLLELLSFDEIGDNNNENQTFANNFPSRTILSDMLDSILRRYNLNYSKYSISVFSLKKHNYIFEKNSDNFLKPASVTKLMTSFAVLEALSDTFNFRTTLYTEDTDISDGIINGNVFIHGVGDPKITLSDLDNLVQKFISLGIKKIEGKIIADGTLYDKNMNRFSYSGDADEVEPVAPISALSLEKNRIKVLINTSVQGENPKIQVIPHSEHFILSNNCKLISTPAKAKKKVGVRFSAHSKINESGNQIIYLNGTLKKNSSYGVEDFNLTPELTFANALRYRLTSNGIKVLGNCEIVKRKNKINYSNLNPITEISRPISEVISEMNKNSDNYLAENLFKLAGANFNHDSTTSVSSKMFIDSLIHLISQSSEQIKKTKNQFKINDGSGLSRRNMFSSRLICEMLKYISRKSYFPSFMKSLAICGFDGTLAKRLRGTSAQMNLTAKTGTHRDVSGLAGFVKDKDGEMYIFTFLFNGPSVGTYKMIENELGLQLSDFSEKDKTSSELK